MTKDIILSAENISKQYRLGVVGTGTISHDLNRWWSKVRGKEDPYLKIGEVNDRSTIAESDYVWALQDINFEVERGEVLGIIGKNGAGKSTLLKILSRITSPTTGTIKTKGRIASLLEVGTGFHGEMTGRENIFLNGAILGMTKKEIKSKIDEIIEFSGCERYIDTPVKRYSSGMTVRLAFAVAAFLDPEILVVDEVLAVGDAEFQKKAIGKMQEISRGGGRTVLFVSHNLAAVKQLCTRGILMENGRVKFDGGMDETIDEYLEHKTINNLIVENVKNRTGTKDVIFSEFYIENFKNIKIDLILSGSALNLVFIIKVNQNNCKNVDLGFSFHDTFGEYYTILYSSFQNQKFDFQEKGYYKIICQLNDFNFASGKIDVIGRITVNGIESDWVKEPIGKIEVEMGDFYNTGSFGQKSSAPFLVKGHWSAEKIKQIISNV